MICTPCSLNTSCTLACRLDSTSARGARLGLDRLADEAVLDVEIRERRLEDVRGGVGEYALRAARGLDEHCMHLPPRRVVADRHDRIHDEALALDGARIVLRDAGQGQRVRQRELLAEARAQARGEHPHLDDRALVLADAHVLARAERARVHEDQSARRLADDARRADRQHQAEQHRQPLERLRSRAGNVRVRHGDGEDPHREGREPPRRTRAVGVQPIDLHASCLHAFEESGEDAGGRAGNEEYRDGDQQLRDRRRHRHEDVRHRVREERVELLAPGARVRETAEDVADPLVGQEEHDGPEDRRSIRRTMRIARSRCRISVPPTLRWPAASAASRTRRRDTVRASLRNSHSRHR